MIVVNIRNRCSTLYPLALSLALLCQGIAAAGQNHLSLSANPPIGDPGIPDTLRIDYFAAGLGRQIIVPIRFFNDENLGALQVIVSYDTASLVIDSVSFLNTTVPGAQFVVLDSIAGKVNAGIFLSGVGVIPAQTGLFAELYLSQKGIPGPMAVIIDTTSIVLDEITTIRTVFSASNPAVSIFPMFAGGVGEILNYVPGDADNNGKVNIADITFLIARIFNFGPPPPIPAAADPDGSCRINIGDITFLISRIFNFGTEPKIGCAE